MSIKLIIFDIGNTIFKQEKSDKFEKMQEILNCDISMLKNNFYEIFNKNNKNLKDLTYKLLQSLNINDDKLQTRLLEYLTSLQNRKGKFEFINDNILEIFEYIKKQNIKLILCSNSNVLSKNNDKQLKPYVDDIERTYKIGFLKNEDGFYKYFENKYQLSSNEILSIGDDIENDFEIPKSYGWNSILFTENMTSSELLSKIKFIIDKMKSWLLYCA